MNALIRAEDLTKAYASNGAAMVALRGIDLEIARGEFVAIMGPSGSGKSTLLHLLGGLDRPSGGKLFFDGQRVDELSEGAWATRRRTQIGFVFQAYNLIGNLTVADNIEIPALLAGASGSTARARREQLLNDLGIGDTARAVPARLSGGEQQRVAVARALVNEPDVLLADEPTGNLDSATSLEVLGLLRRYHAAGQTVVLVTHDARVASAADRVLTMRDGLIREETTLRPGDNSHELLAHLIELEV